MKKLKIAVMALMLFAGVSNVKAQDADNLWALSFGVNMVDINNGGFSDIGGMVKDYLGLSDLNTIPAVSHLSVTRYLNNGFNVELGAALNKIDQAALAGEVDGLSFFSIDAACKYDLNALGFIGETGWFDPYIKFGIGMTWVDGDDSLTMNPGAGFNTWFNDNVGMNFASSFKTSSGIGKEFPSIEASNYFQHTIGLMIRFNGDE